MGGVGGGWQEAGVRGEARGASADGWAGPPEVTDLNFRFPEVRIRTQCDRRRQGIEKGKGREGRRVVLLTFFF